MKLSAGYELYNQGLNFYLKGNFREARNYFERSYLFKDTRLAALTKLIRMDLKEGKNLEARTLLEDNLNDYHEKIFHLYGCLEMHEFNFNKSEEYYKEYAKYIELSTYEENEMAQLKIQQGKFSEAKEILERIKDDDRVYAKEPLIALNILLNRYSKAYTLLREMNPKELEPRRLKDYENTMAYVSFLLNKFDPNLEKNPNSRYIIDRIQTDDDKALFEHVKRHFYPKRKIESFCFLDSIDLEKLLEEAKEKISYLNPNYWGNSSIYTFRTDKKIGYLKDLEVDGLEVVTFIDSPKIITMYPVSLSDKFDNEGFTTSNNLKLIRENARKR